MNKCSQTKDKLPYKSSLISLFFLNRWITHHFWTDRRCIYVFNAAVWTSQSQFPHEKGFIDFVMSGEHVATSWSFVITKLLNKID